MLRIRQMAIVSELEVEFGAGLNVITGETGAGKSILVNALKLVLGARARPELVRTGADQAEIEALFDIAHDASLQDHLRAEGFFDCDQIVIRRVIQAEGRSRAYVNGQLTTTSQLERLASALVDISSQHEHQSLVNAPSHLGYLDAFGAYPDALDRVRRCHASLVEQVRALDEERERQAQRTEREDLLRYQWSEIERAAPRAGEDASVEAELVRCRNADRLSAALRRLAEGLDGGEDPVSFRLARLSGEARDASRLDPSFLDIASRLEALAVEAQELSRELARRDRVERFDPARLAELEERAHLLRRLVRKYGGSIEAVIAYGENAQRELAELDEGAERSERIEYDIREAKFEAGNLARALSELRRDAAARLGRAITTELEGLGMGGARVEVEVARVEGGPDGIVVDGARLGRDGIDRVEFLIAPNRGEEPRPLRKVASGGELSRALLALKRVLAGLGPCGSYVFDEVDVGVGGAVAEVIGRKIADVAEHHQVLCITHLPQVAARGARHLHVSKSEVDGRTLSVIRQLSPEERVSEIACMLGGVKVTEAARDAARALLAG